MVPVQQRSARSSYFPSLPVDARQRGSREPFCGLVRRRNPALSLDRSPTPRRCGPLPLTLFRRQILRCIMMLELAGGAGKVKVCVDVRRPARI